MNKTVGVVIPIYNVEKYLKECLDSVINQTYKNLQVVLVNDGSTDENSFNIAKEYTLKDERFILFDKKNGGLSSARNVGIEYFSGEYILKNKTQILEKNSLIEFNIEGNNPYEIYTVYKSYKAFHTTKDLADFIYPSIDYIIFLDSDDYWELDCIEECVKRMNGVDVVWFNSNLILDGIDRTEYKTRMEWSGYDKGCECVISRDDWIQHHLKYKISSFWFVWEGMINFNFLTKINNYFKSSYFFQDSDFGIRLFSMSKYIYIYPEKKHNYRIRPYSMLTSQNNIILNSNNCNRMNIYNHFSDYLVAKKYEYAVAWINVVFDLIDFVNHCNDVYVINFIQKVGFIKYFYYHHTATDILYISEDPLNIKDKLFILEPYINKKDDDFYGAKERLKNELPYKIGCEILKLKKIKNIINFPINVIKIIKKHKRENKNYNDIISRYPFLKFPNIKKYKDYDQAIASIQKQLTYKLGIYTISICKFWFLGSFLILPFWILYIILKHKYIKNNKKTDNNELLEIVLQQNCSLAELRKQFEDKDSFDYLINNIKIKEEYKFIFYKILNIKNKVIIDGTKSCLDLAKFSYFDQNTYFYGFEINPIGFALLKKEMKTNNKIRIMHYYPYVKNTIFRVFSNVNDGYLHLMPDIDIPNSEKIRAINFIKFLFNIFNKHNFITLLILDINRDNYELILNIIDNKIYQKI
ncbi:TPA: glycosyltransferase family 2 protein, partial [Campylobacter jejuni]|nr:glycosyltransferase family 2 protein [Campylobacter jejuni]